MHHWRYLKQTLRHKWHVFKWCWKFGIPVRGVLHDISKFRPSEWFGHANYFGREKRNIKSRVNLDRAWNLHLKRNKHHWQYWVAIPDEGPVCTIDMPMKFRLEMLADWLARSEHRDHQPLKEWFDSKDIILHPMTRMWVRSMVKIWNYMQVRSLEDTATLQ